MYKKGFCRFCGNHNAVIDVEHRMCVDCSVEIKIVKANMISYKGGFVDGELKFRGIVIGDGGFNYVNDTRDIQVPVFQTNKAIEILKGLGCEVVRVRKDSLLMYLNDEREAYWKLKQKGD
jgi:hypothetical protein